VAVIQSHILLSSNLGSPYKYIAADANSSGTITAVDLVHIKRLILGIDATFPGNKLWQFVDSANPGISTNPISFNASRTYNSLPLSVVNQNFYGVKIGDVTWNWNYTVYRGAKVELYHDTAYADAKDSIIIPVKLNSFKDMMAMQYTLSWNYRKMDFVGIRKNLLGLEFGTQETFKGNLAALWVDAGNNSKTLADGTVLFELVLKKKAGVVLDAETLDINSDVTAVEGYDKDLVMVPIAKGSSVIMDRKGSSTQMVSSFKISPNPSDGRIQVTLLSSQSKEITLMLTNVSGKMVYQKKVHVFRGENIIDLDMKQYNRLAAGSYFLSIQGLEKGLVQQVLIINEK